MASPKRELSYGSVEIYHDQVLGAGAFGKVYTAKCGKLLCAAKVLHDTLFMDGDPGAHTITKKFLQECQFLSAIKHPNIVQYLDTTSDPQTQRPVLLMELMDENLTRFLDRSTDPLPYHSQLNICHDVAQALAYLHSNDIVHRDLSSNNVLLIGEGSRAKVTDFGMLKLLDTTPRMTSLTQVPGTPAYMPPEALVTPPHYSSQLDCFSHGVLTLQVITRNFPDPGDASTIIEDERFPTGRINIFIPEQERRKKDIDLIEPSHPLLPIALECLKDRDIERPSSGELCERFATLKKEPRYTQCVENLRGQSYPEAVPKDKELERHQREIENCRKEIEHYQAQLEIYRKKVEQYQRTDLETISEPVLERESAVPKTLKLTWRTGQEPPKDFTQCTVAAHDNTVYISHSHDVFSYSVNKNKWSKLQPSKYECFGMVVVNGILTIVGGRSTGWFVSEVSNDLLCYTSTGMWEKNFPPMPTKRSYPACANSAEHLVVAGGKRFHPPSTATTVAVAISQIRINSQNSQISTQPPHENPLRHLIDEPTDDILYIVEVLNIETHQWFTAKSLPYGCGSLGTKLIWCDGTLYFSDKESIFSCDSNELITTSKKMTNKEICEINATNSAWTRVRKTPSEAVKNFSLANLGDCLLFVGGAEPGHSPSNGIYCYDVAIKSWRVIGEMPNPMDYITTTALPGNELVLVGNKATHIATFTGLP